MIFAHNGGEEYYATRFGASWAIRLKKFIDFETISLYDNPDLISHQFETEMLKKIDTKVYKWWKNKVYR